MKVLIEWLLLRWLPVTVLLLVGPAAVAADREAHQHRLIIQVTTDDPVLMRLALDNAVNVDRHYSELGEEVEMEIIAYGAGLHMLREDSSPVKARIRSISESLRSIRFVACGNTIRTMERNEGGPVRLVPQAEVVDVGVAHIMELQENGWSYVRP
ncbi:hypothetical protein [Bradyrhizobium sp. HKCCYLS20291]|uniref:DsrE family protein n=1 Tax=Bradyrhizobium sp. HKCCYLS20291 TaxID=3420766 RepID=UPI003EBC5ED2